jgi:hypothetical protein
MPKIAPKMARADVVGSLLRRQYRSMPAQTPGARGT